MSTITARPITARPLTARPLTAYALGVSTDGAAFSPLALSPTVWYDPSDLSTMFQDSAGTVPVTASGQPVGRINDKSGNGYHLTQATSTRRPLYQTSGGLHWLLFDGVDDKMSTGSVDLTAHFTLSLFMGHRHTTGGGASPMLFSNTSTPDSVAGSFRADLSQAAGKYIVQVRGVSTRSIKETINAFLSPITNVTYRKFKYGAPSEVAVRVDGADQTLNNLDTTNPVVGPFANAILHMGSRGDDAAGTRMAGNVYSIFLVPKECTAQEISSAEAWVAAKTGVVL